jgi:hypothetical protein
MRILKWENTGTFFSRQNSKHATCVPHIPPLNAHPHTQIMLITLACTWSHIHESSHDFTVGGSVTSAGCNLKCKCNIITCAQMTPMCSMEIALCTIGKASESVKTLVFKSEINITSKGSNRASSRLKLFQPCVLLTITHESRYPTPSA